MRNNNVTKKKNDKTADQSNKCDDIRKMSEFTSYRIAGHSGARPTQKATETIVPNGLTAIRYYSPIHMHTLPSVVHREKGKRLLPDTTICRLSPAVTRDWACSNQTCLILQVRIGNTHMHKV